MVDKWTLGAEQFTTFWERLDPQVQTNEREDLTNSPARIFLKATLKPRGDIQAVFLREKPMAWLNSDAPLDCDEFGLQQWEDFLYSPELVEQVMKRYPEIFGAYGSIEDLLLSLNKSKSEKHLERGLVLGIPKGACERFANSMGRPNVKVCYGGRSFYDSYTGATGFVESSNEGEAIKEDYHTGQVGWAFRTFGVSWVDYKDQDMRESYQRMYHLREAFIASKILKVGLI